MQNELFKMESFSDSKPVSTEDNLIPQVYTVQEVFGFNSQTQLNGFAPGHPLVPKATAGYVWDKNMVKDAIAWLSSDNPDPVYLSGPTGCGKTDFPKNLFSKLNIPTVIVSAKSSTEPDDILGRTQLVNGNTVFVPGPLLKAYSSGYAIIWDEIDAYPAEVILSLHRMLERGVITLDDGTTIHPAEKNLMFATANTRGDGQGADVYAATNIVNLASMNRFEKWRMKYPEMAIELKILSNEFATSLEESVLESVVKTANDIRKAYTQGNCPGPISIRDLQRWCRKLIQFWNRKDVIPVYHSFDLAFGNGVDEYVLQMLHVLIQTHFGTKPPVIDGI